MYAIILGFSILFPQKAQTDCHQWSVWQVFLWQVPRRILIVPEAGGAIARGWQYEEKIKEAAVGCPVNVIKYEEQD